VAASRDSARPWELTQAGQRVALVEADRIAAARWYAESQRQAVERVFAVASSLDIDCDLERVPSFAYVESPDRLDQIRAEVDAAAEAGLAASWVAETGLPIRSPAPFGWRIRPSSTPASTSSHWPRTWRELVVAAVLPAERDPGGVYVNPEQNTRSVRTAGVPVGSADADADARRSAADTD
jgi:hypothetical protein